MPGEKCMRVAIVRIAIVSVPAEKARRRISPASARHARPPGSRNTWRIPRHTTLTRGCEAIKDVFLARICAP
jgi:hypothetical protein